VIHSLEEKKFKFTSTTKTADPKQAVGLKFTDCRSGKLGLILFGQRKNLS
jgi:hypothetical protein